MQWRQGYNKGIQSIVLKSIPSFSCGKRDVESLNKCRKRNAQAHYARFLPGHEYAPANQVSHSRGTLLLLIGLVTPARKGK